MTTTTTTMCGAPLITAHDASVERGGRLVLRAIDLALAARELVVVAGLSGAGKSTLLELLSGRRAPDEGEVVHGPAADQLRIGFVPQDDLVHRDLPLQASLVASAALTVAEGTEARQARVDGVLVDLDLWDQRLVPVGSLSGGQRKRASIAAELLAHPDVLFLDEPTSGLDPLTAVEIITTLRSVAARGAAVVLTSHHLDDLRAADRVVLLDRGGVVAYDGPPADAADALGTRDLHGAYRVLAAPHAPANPRGPGGRRQTKQLTRPGTRRDRDANRHPVPGGLRQTRVLAQRNARLLARGRLTLAVLLGAPVLVITMMATLFPADLGGTPTESLLDQLTFWMAFAAFFFGLSFGLLQVVDEVPIVRREHLLGVRLGPYLAAKVLVLAPLLMLVTTVLVLVLSWLDRLPAMTVHQSLQLLGTLWLASSAALALGLAASAIVRTAAQAALALPMLCFPQVLFAGAVVPIDAMPGAGRWTSVALVNRWAYEALGSVLGADARASMPWACWMALGALAAASMLAAHAALARRMRPI
jgi:ABC-type multidrug transport system ATPase subunit